MRKVIVNAALAIAVLGGAAVLFASPGPAAVGDGPGVGGLDRTVPGSELEKSLLTLCDADSTTAYRQIRDRLMAYSYSESVLDRIENALARGRASCSRPGDTALVVDLMRLVGENWRQDGDFERADAAYKTAFAHSADAPGDLLERMNVLQAWASLKSQMHDGSGARKLAALQSAQATLAYYKHASSPELAASSLEFEAAILSQTGDPQGARRKAGEARDIRAAEKKCAGLCAWSRN